MGWHTPVKTLATLASVSGAPWRWFGLAIGFRCGSHPQASVAPPQRLRVAPAFGEIFAAWVGVVVGARTGKPWWAYQWHPGGGPGWRPDGRGWPSPTGLRRCATTRVGGTRQVVLGGTGWSWLGLDRRDARPTFRRRLCD